MALGIMNSTKQPPIGQENMSINRQREIKMQALTRAKIEDAKVPDPMTHENYGYKKPHYGK